MLTVVGSQSHCIDLRDLRGIAIIRKSTVSIAAMDPADTLYESSLAELQQIGRGKVRDIYSVDDQHLLIVTTDRLSAYDVVLPDPVPGKGQVLTTISNFWFDMMQDLVPNHLSDLTLDSIIDDEETLAPLADRSIVVRRLHPLPIEAVVRGYLCGSGWRDYQRDGMICGIELPKDLPQAARLPEPVFTPATKAEAGAHDENISFERTCEIIGTELAVQVRDLSVQIYTRAAEYALGRGIIIADTKFEFGLDDAGKLFVIDEILTPDSSRFWPLSDYRTGISPPSFDKQFVRDYLDTLDWDKTPPGPRLPPDIIQQTGEKYREALRVLTA